jgi:molybdopterin converting factor small subunit
MDSSLCDVVAQGLRPSAHPEHEDAVDVLSLQGGESPEAHPANPEEGEGTWRLWYVFRPPCRSSPSSRVPSKQQGPRSGLRAQLCDERGAIRKFVNLYRNNEDIRFLAGEQTVLTDGDEVAIIPAVAGG